jgi:hypothetical protein
LTGDQLQDRQKALDLDVSLHLQRPTDEVTKQLEMLFAAGSSQPMISLLTW